MESNMFQIMSEAREINKKVNEMHHSHYKNSKTGLVDPKEAPNVNLIYHLYNDGSIEYTKGGDVYGRRSVFSLKSSVNDEYKHLFHFPTTGSTGYFYAILTEKECLTMRKTMEAWVEKFKKEKESTDKHEVLKAIMRLYGESIYYKLMDALIKGEKTVFNTIPELVHVLRCIEYGYNPDTTNESGETLLMWAAASGCKPIVALLLGKADLYRTNSEGLTFLHYIDSPELLSYIISSVPKKLLLAGNKTGNTPFHTAILRQNYGLAEIYLQAAPELVNSRTSTNETALFYLATDKKGREFAEKLISVGADKTITNTSGKTARDVALEAESDFADIL